MKRITSLFGAVALLLTHMKHATAQGAPPQPGPRFHVLEATIDGIHAAMRRGELTCTQLVQAYLNRIAAYDQAGPKLDAIQTVNPTAMALAAKLDAEYRDVGPVGPLHCIPVIVKDEIETSFMPTTYGSAIFKQFTPPKNATIVDRLQAAGAIILAKANMGEFAVGYAGTAFGDCHNVYDITRDPGGSSCGPAVGEAANFATVAIGEDTGGSVRGPASNESLVGLRPTLPLVSRAGLLPSTPTRDTLGPMTRSVRDAAIVLDVIAGYDPADPVTAQSYGRKPETYTSYLERNGLRGMRFGVIRTAVGRDANPNDPGYREIQSILTAATRDLRERGAEVVDPIVIPRLRELLEQGGNGIAETEQATNAYLAQYPQAPVHTLKDIVDSPLLLPARHDDLARRLGHNTAELSYLQEQQARETLRTIVLKVMADNRLDAFVYGPSEREPAPIPATTTPGSIRRFAATLAYPALGVPAGYTSHGLPIGIEFLGRPYSEGTLLRAAYDYERTTRHRHPPATTPPLPGEP
ncbi:MAG TPA: amidase family protein [Xanthobacteraceae bacterium]|nr:amidase family protein [Xanthobacteraceae bacterium]